MLVIGHRGASAAAKENTVEAFRLADAMGADGVELDVRRSADGRLLVKHDPLPSTPDELTGLPTLAEILASCAGMLVNVEIKNSADELGHDPSAAVVEPTIEEMRRHGPAERWVISSFDWETIERCREVAPDMMTAYLVMDATPNLIERTAAGGHGAIHPFVRSVTAEVVERCHAAGLAVNTWTCNDPERIGQLADVGVDGVCTDVPDVALSVLGREGRPVSPRWGRPA